MEQPTPEPTPPTAAPSDGPVTVRTVDSLAPGAVRDALDVGRNLVILPVVVLPPATPAATNPAPAGTPFTAPPPHVRTGRWVAPAPLGRPTQLALAAVAALALLMALALVVAG